MHTKEHMKYLNNVETNNNDASHLQLKLSRECKFEEIIIPREVRLYLCTEDMGNNKLNYSSWFNGIQYSYRFENDARYYGCAMSICARVSYKHKQELFKYVYITTNMYVYIFWF